MKRILYVIIVPALILLTGCISSSPSKRYFQLHIDDALGETKAGTAIKKTGKTILVEAVGVEDVYNDYRIVYRTSPYQLNYYSYDYWIKRPGKIIRDAISSYLSKTNVFKKVIYHFAEGEADYLLKAHVDVLEEYDLKQLWYAHLKMDIEIKDFKANKTVLYYRFDKRKRLSERRVERVPVVISKILKEEMAAVIRQLLEKIGNNEAAQL